MTDRWVKNWQSIETWRWYRTPHMAHLWQHLIRRANYSDTEFEGRIIKRGQIVVGRNALSAQTGISEQSVRTCLKRLKSTNEITTESTSKFTIITIINYEIYQASKEEINQQINQEPNQQLTSNQPATNQQLTTSNNNKNNNKEKKEDKYIPPLGYKTYGEFNNVPLLESEFNLYIAKVGSRILALDAINRYSAWLVNNPASLSKKHYPVLLTWPLDEARKNSKAGENKEKIELEKSMKKAQGKQRETKEYIQRMRQGQSEEDFEKKRIEAQQKLNDE